MAGNAAFVGMIDDWVATAEERLQLVPKLACNNISHAIKDATPVASELPELTDMNGVVIDIGRLRSSWWPSVGSAGGAGRAPPPEDITNALEPPQTYFFTNRTSYAFRIEYGFIGLDSLGRRYNQSGYYMVNNAVALWQMYVEEAVAEVVSGSGPVGGVEGPEPVNLSAKIEESVNRSHAEKVKSALAGEGATTTANEVRFGSMPVLRENNGWMTRLFKRAAGSNVKQDVGSETKFLGRERQKSDRQTLADRIRGSTTFGFRGKQ